MSDSPKQFAPDDLRFFALIQELMHTHPNRAMVDEAHKLALASPRIRPLYTAGAWHGFDLKAAESKTNG